MVALCGGGWGSWECVPGTPGFPHPWGNPTRAFLAPAHPALRSKLHAPEHTPTNPSLSFGAGANDGVGVASNDVMAIGSNDVKVVAYA